MQRAGLAGSNGSGAGRSRKQGHGPEEKEKGLRSKDCARSGLKGGTGTSSASFLGWRWDLFERISAVAGAIDGDIVSPFLSLVFR